jgi:cyclopropane-fatty-acyl-phospholipid synthase
MDKLAKKTMHELATLANVKVNGDRPWDIQIHNENFYPRILKGSSLALGESYMDGWWDCQQLDQLICNILKAKIEDKIKKNYKLIFNLLLASLFNYQSKKRAPIVGKKHYDTGNPLFRAMLDSNMNYTCGYWKNTDALDQAQIAKLDLVCQKIGLKADMKVLDIGCGWGAFAKHAAQNYGATVVGITISQEQVELGSKLCQGLPVKIKFQDYRTVDEQFDRIISLGMFEHVGYKNYKTYMRTVNRCLKDDGLFLLHTIGSNKSSVHNDPWLHKYIFPNSMLPSSKQIAKAYEGLFVMEDWHNFGPDYDKTLMAWHNNFTQHWDKLKANYDERFQRMWNYYLLSCAGTFRAREAQLWQIVFSKDGVDKGYASIR